MHSHSPPPAERESERASERERPEGRFRLRVDGAPLSRAPLPSLPHVLRRRPTVRPAARPQPPTLPVRLRAGRRRRRRKTWRSRGALLPLRSGPGRPAPTTPPPPRLASTTSPYSEEHAYVPNYIHTPALPPSSSLANSLSPVGRSRCRFLRLWPLICY